MYNHHLRAWFCFGTNTLFNEMSEVSDFFTGKQSINNGELDRYILEFHHEAIL